MTFTTFQQCSDAKGWHEIEIDSSTKGKTYVVTIPPWGKEDAMCDCRGFKFRGECRHLDIAKELACDWSSLKRDTQTETQRIRRLCPECGESTIIITVEGTYGETEK